MADEEDPDRGRLSRGVGAHEAGHVTGCLLISSSILVFNFDFIRGFSTLKSLESTRILLAP